MLFKLDESSLEYIIVIAEGSGQITIASGLLSFRGDKLESVGLLGSLENLLVACVKPTIQDVLLQCVVEEQWLLLDEAEPLAQLINVQCLGINTVDKNLAELRIVESHHEGNECGLALARFTYDSNVVLRVDFQVKSLENPLLKTSWIAEPNIFKLDFASELSHIDLIGRTILVNDTINGLYSVITSSFVLNFISFCVSLSQTFIFIFFARLDLELDKCFCGIIVSRACVDL